MKNLKNLKLGFKILAGLLVVALVFSIIMPIMGKSANADYTYGYYLQDTDQYLTEQQTDALEKNMQAAANASKCNVAIFIIDSLDGCDSVWDYAEEIVNPLLSEDEGEIALIYYIETLGNGDTEKYSAFTYSDTAAAVYSDLTLKITTAFNADILVYDEITALNNFCKRIIEYGENVYVSLNNSEFKNSSDKLLTGGDNWKVALADYDDCLTYMEEKALLSIMAKTAKTAKCNIGIVITRDLGGMSDVDYTEAFLDDNFGINSDSIVLMLLNTHDNPEYRNYVDWISLEGTARKKYQSKLDKIWDELYFALGSSSDYSKQHFYSACTRFCQTVKLYGSVGIMRVLLSITQHPGGAMFSMLISLAVAFLVTALATKKYRRKASISASQYIDRRTINLKYERDDFIREYTTSVRIDSGGHGGGHSGGGGGGGHHGGGGGRHR